MSDKPYFEVGKLYQAKDYPDMTARIVQITAGKHIQYISYINGADPAEFWDDYEYFFRIYRPEPTTF